MGGKAQLGWFGPWSVLSRPPARTMSKSSCTWAQRAGVAHGTAPSALPGSIAMFGTFSHQPDVPSCHRQRGRPASTGRGDSHFRAKAWRWPAVMTPRRAALRANDVGASHRAADGAGPSIPGARTHAHGTSMGAAAAVSCIWSAFALKALGDSPIGHHRDSRR